VRWAAQPERINNNNNNNNVTQICALLLLSIYNMEAERYQLLDDSSSTCDSHTIFNMLIIIKLPIMLTQFVFVHLCVCVCVCVF
jgi:hypothetical protein